MLPGAQQATLRGFGLRRTPGSGKPHLFASQNLHYVTMISPLPLVCGYRPSVNGYAPLVRRDFGMIVRSGPPRDLTASEG